MDFKPLVAVLWFRGSTNSISYYYKPISGDFVRLIQESQIITNASNYNIAFHDIELNFDFDIFRLV